MIILSCSAVYDKLVGFLQLLWFFHQKVQTISSQLFCLCVKVSRRFDKIVDSSVSVYLTLDHTLLGNLP